VKHSSAAAAAAAASRGAERYIIDSEWLNPWRVDKSDVVTLTVLQNALHVEIFDCVGELT